MSKTAKLMILIGLCLACIGAMFSSFNLKSLAKPFYNAEKYEKKEYEISYYEVNNLLVETSNENIEIIPTNGDQIIVTYYESEVFNYNISLQNQTLKVIKEGKIKWQIFNFNFNVFEPNITIEVPYETYLTLDIKTSNSKIEVKSLNINEGIFKTSNSSIVLNSMTAQKLNLKTANGNININNIEATSINATTSNARITAISIKTNLLFLKTSNGDIVGENLLSPKIDLKTSNGDIEVNVAGEKDDYRQELITSNGEIEVENYTYGNRFYDNENKTSYIKAKTSNADISLGFND